MFVATMHRQEEVTGGGCCIGQTNRVLSEACGRRNWMRRESKAN